MSNLGRLFDVPALSPEALETAAGLKFALAQRSEIFLPRYSRTVTYALVQSYPGIGESGSRLVLQSQGLPTEKESQTLYLAIAARPARTSHGPRLFLSYRTRHGFRIAFSYVNECASYINVASPASE
jgi:hypothetical protein